MPIQFDIDQLFDGVPSDQLRETVGQVNLRLQMGQITIDEARTLVFQARQAEILTRYSGIPPEDGSAQTLDVEHRRDELMQRARK